MPTISTTIRAPEEWLADLDAWASREGLSRTDALLITSRVGRRVLEGLMSRRLTPEEWGLVSAGGEVPKRARAR